MLEENMLRLGFSPSETKIYMHLLKEGSSYPNRISSETRLNRTNVYEALDRLVSKGVVSFVTRNKLKWFEAKVPSSLLSLVKEKEEEIKINKNSLIKDIKSLRIEPTAKPLEANIFVGKKGLRMLFEEILEVKKPISIIASQLQFKKLFGPYYELWHKKRIELKIRQRSIFSEKFKGQLEKREFLKYRFVDERFTSPTTTIIYGENCLFIQWSKEPFAVKISNKEIAQSHQNYFNMLWDL